MALIVKDRVREASTTSGTGTLTLSGAISGFQTFSVIGNGNTTYYTIVDVSTGSWEVGIGTYTASGTTLSRDIVLESSNGGALVNFSATAKDVFCTYPAERSVSQADVGTDPNEIPLNQYLGDLAYQSSDSINITGGVATLDTATITSIQNDTAISNVEPSLMLNFAQVKKLDPRITYARASTATYYDGVTNSKAEQNLLLYSQEFDNTYWVKSGMTVSANQVTAPDGTLTADLVYPTTTSGIIYLNSGNAVGNTASIYVKASGFSWVAIGTTAVANSMAYFNLSTGTVGSVGANLANASIVNFGGGWYRVSFNVVTVNGTAGIAIWAVDGDAPLSITPNGTNGIYLWGAQLEQRSAVSSYTPTTTQAITLYQPTLLTAPSGVARFDHNPISTESLGFLVEEQRVNLVTYSEDFANVVYSKVNSAITSNINVAPDGTLTADSLIENSTASALHYMTRTVTTTGAHSYSIYAKQNGRQYIVLIGYSGAVSLANGAVFDLNAGVVVSTGANLSSASIASVGNGWYRCQIVGTALLRAPQLHLMSNATTFTYTGDGYSGIFIWGAQLEAGAFPTSYIKTEASQVTRAADSASMTNSNFSSWYNQGEGSFATISSNSYATHPSGSNAGIFVVNDTTSNNFISIWKSSGTSSYEGVIVKNAVNQATYTIVSATSANQTIKGALSYKFNDSAFTGNGGVVYIDTLCNIPIVSQIEIGQGIVSNWKYNGHIKKLAYYPARLSDAELQEMTS